MLGQLKRLLLRLWTWLVAVIGNWGSVPKPPPGPTIAEFSPDGGWPGSIVTISGSGYSEARDDHVVMIGGARALVFRATPTQLIVVAGEATVSGPIHITVAGLGAVTSTHSFTILPVPDLRDLGVGGPPVFFHGPQPGTPKLGVPDQPVLVVFTYPTDQNPGTAAQRAAQLAGEKGRFEQARRFWQEASYGSTSWKFTYTDWLPLPADRNYYVWEARDTYFGRRALIHATRRAATMHNGQLFATHIDELMATVSVSNPTSPFTASYTGKTHGTGIQIRGDRAFISCGTNGLWVYDLVNSPATFVNKVATGAYFADLDVAGNVLAVAALEAGLLLYDVSITALPTLKGTHFDAGKQVSAVRLGSNRAFIGIDTRIRTLGTTNPAAPVVLGEVELGALVLDLALQGTLLAAATDGGGIVLIDVAPAVPVILGAVLAVERVHGVALAGTRMYAAGAGSGLAIYDIGNPAGPIALGSIALSGEALDVTVDGTMSYVALGRRKLAVVDCGNPATPAARGMTTLGGPGGGMADPDLTPLRASIDEAEQNQGLAQRYGALLVDALKAAGAAGFALDAFQGVVVVVNGPFLRGASAPTNQFKHEDTGETLRLNETKGAYYVASGAPWGRIAHETGHWLGMWDIYEEWQADGTLKRGTAQDWCISGVSEKGALWCGHQINEIMHFYRAGASPSNVAALVWSPASPPLDQPFDIVAHDGVQNSDPNRVHLVRLEVSSGLLYFIEVRQKPSGQIFDQQLVGTNPVTEAAVVVTRATQGTSISNTYERPVMLVGVLDVGQQVVDAARGLSIHVDELVQNRPAVYRVRVKWNQFIPGDPNGKFDLTLTPWNTDEWETPDIWIDSPRNNSGATPIYEQHEDGDDTRPRLNGDRPWVKHDNVIMARIRNTGPQAASDVFVSVYTASPPGIGDNGNWALLETVTLPTVAGRDPAVPGSGEAIVKVRWQPDADAHTCIKVAIYPQVGEIETDNNSTQENVFTFDSPGASSHDPVLIDAMVRSPFTIWKRVDAVVRGLPYGWHAVIDHSWVWTGPKGERAMKAVVWTDFGAPYSFTPGALLRHEHIVTEAKARIEGWTTFDDRYLPIGGILADVKATRKVRFHWEVAGTPRGAITGHGCLEPPMVGVPITVEVTGRRGSTLVYAVTNAQGCIDLDADLGLVPGEYQVQAFVTAGAQAAETETPPRTVHVSG
ncbi:MAG: IPT/TIG domain-containing protein [Caldimonas sp.]